MLPVILESFNLNTRYKLLHVPREDVKERQNRFFEMNFSKEQSRRNESHHSSSWLAGGTQMYVPMTSQYVI